MFKETHSIPGTRDIQRAIGFYTQQLGFKLAFGDKADPPNYAGFRRDAVELHMQFQSSEYDRWAQKHPHDARMMGGFLYFRYLQKRKIGPSRFPGGWGQVANRSRLKR